MQKANHVTVFSYEVKQKLLPDPDPQPLLVHLAVIPSIYMTYIFYSFSLGCSITAHYLLTDS